MREELHDLIHALTRLEKYHEEQKRYIEIANRLINKMVLKIGMEVKDDKPESDR